MNNNTSELIAKKIIQRQLLYELCKNGVIDFGSTSNIIKKLNEDIIRLEKLQEKNKDMKNIIVKIPV